MDWHTPSASARETFLADLSAACFDDVNTTASREDPLRPFRHRVFLDAAAFSRITGWEPDTEAHAQFYVVLDLRLSRLNAISICHVNLSVWSGPPWSCHHRPDDVEKAEVDLSSPDLIAGRFHETFREVHRATATLLDQSFTVANLRVFGRPYRAPIFWGAISADRPEDPVDLIGAHGRLDLAGATTELLDLADERDEAVGRSIVDGDLLVLRTFKPDAEIEQDVPTYLLVPAQARSRARRHEHTHGGSHPSTRLTRQEDAMRRAITRLTDLESEAAACLWDAESDLDIWDNHLHVYSNAADKAGRIWDGLASHLPIERRSPLARLHKSIQLLHQTLIQGVADVDRMLTSVGESQAEVASQITALDNRFRHSFTETRIGGRRTISEALTATGHFAEVRRRSEAMTSRAGRAAQSYRNLLTAITDSFNERRVRENDVLQRSGAVLAAGVAVFGLITAVNAILDAKLPVPPSDRWWVWAPILAVSACLMIVLVKWAVSYLRIGKLGGRRYRLVYRRVWRFLRACSSVRLDNLSSMIEDPLAVRTELRHHAVESLTAFSEAKHAREEARNHVWHHYDRELAQDFAAVWDLIDLLPGDERVIESVSPPDPARAVAAPSRRAVRRLMARDRRQLQRMVEKWSLRTLLFTERPREMWRYNLVQVTLLYRAAFPLMGRDHHVVSFTDLHFVLGRFPRQAFRTDQVSQISRWLDARATVLWEQFESGRTPDFRARESDVWWLRLAPQIVEAWRLRRALKAAPENGRGACLLADIANAGLVSGVGGYVDLDIRVADLRSTALRKIEATRNGAEAVLPPPPKRP